MKKIFTLIVMVLCATALFAQAPEKFTYQAVVRNASNALMSNASVGVRVSILQGGVNGALVYMETQTGVTNANGLITLQIGEGNAQQGTFASVDWANGSYFLKIETDPNGGSNYTITTTQQLLSVPYALYAKDAGNGFSGDYNDLTNTPTIPTVPTNVSAFTNDAGYITMDSVPSIPTVPTNVSAFNNDAGYITGYTETDPQFNAWNKDYNDLINKPTIPTVPTNVSAFTNDAGYITGYAEQQTLSDVTANGNSAGNRQLKEVSDPTENFDAVNLRTLNLLMDSLRADFQQQLQQLQQSQQQMQQQIDSLQEIVDALDTTHHNHFVCGTSTVTDYEGNAYATVQIGDQCWMRDNLRTTYYADGTAIPAGETNTDATFPYYYDYSSSDIPLSQRGYLYNWSAVMHNAPSSSANPSGVQGICPTGWHVPSDEEWTQLTSYVSAQNEYLCSDNAEFIAKVLASTSGWSSSTSTCAVGNMQNLNNATGFNASPAGYLYNLGFTNSGKYAYFWTSTEASSANAWYRSLNFNYAYVYRNNYGKHLGYSVRCIRDEGGSSTVQLPTVTTATMSDITANSATSGGNVTSDGGATVTGRGVCWSTSQNPTVSDDHTTDGSGTGSFTSNLANLTPSTTYYVRAYATNSMGTAYGNEESFTTTAAALPQDGQPCVGAETVTDYDGHTYNTVQLGSQCWMAENLRTSHYSDGTAIPTGDGWSSTEPLYYILEDSLGHYIYNWKAVMHNSSSSQATPSGVQGVCPTGWHVPSDAEWTELETYVGNQSQYFCNNDSSFIAKALSATSGWIPYSETCAVGNDQSTNNSTGFGAFPVDEYPNLSYALPGTFARFWSSTEYVDGTARYLSLHYNAAYVSRSATIKYYGCSVRCLRD